jgi:hypothetical protein
MATAYSPLIVTDGLVMYLDAGNTKSYPGSGTTWTDISRNSNNETLVNSPTFNSANGGSIVFDGVDDYAINSNLKYSPFTYDVYFKGGSGYISRLFGYGWGLYVNTTNQLAVWVDTNTSHRSTTTYISYSSNLITNISISFANSAFSLYKNGTFLQTVSTPSSSVYSTTTQFCIGADTIASSLFTGNIYTAKMYNRGLSAQEIAQNYNATKTRFGL